jgi:uncharacterized protein
MRLSNEQIRVIKAAVHECDPTARVYLFGSRTDDTMKGGDIDLLIVSAKLSYDDKIRIKQRLMDKLGEQKIDIIISANIEAPFIKMALNEGVPL